MENKYGLTYELSEAEMEKFTAFNESILADKEFLKDFENAVTKEDAYKLLKDKNYISFSLEEFLDRLKKVEDLTDQALGTIELSDEELAEVAGGSGFTDFWKNHWKSVVKYIPFIGDLSVTFYEIASGETQGTNNKISQCITTAGGIALEAGLGVVCPLGGWAMGQIYTRVMSAGRKGFMPSFL